MQIANVKAASMSAWVLAVIVFGYVSGAASVAVWAAVAALAVAGPAVMARLWSPPSPSMSESIRDVLR
jgi:hypothetical protein